MLNASLKHLRENRAPSTLAGDRPIALRLADSLWNSVLPPPW